MKYYLEKEDWKDIVQREYIENNKSRKEVAEILGVTKNQFVKYLWNNRIYKYRGARGWKKKYKQQLASGLLQCNICGQWKEKEEFIKSGNRRRPACKLCYNKQRMNDRGCFIIPRKELIKCLKLRQHLLLHGQKEHQKIKYCTNCNTWKNKEDFAKSGGKYLSICSDCSHRKREKELSIAVPRERLIKLLRLRQYILLHGWIDFSQISYCIRCREWKRKEEFNNRVGKVWSYCKECEHYFDRKRRLKRSDAKYKIRMSIGRSIRRHIQNGKDNKHCEDILGYTFEELKQHLESLFQKGMNWDNYGFYGWHIDHKLPISSFNFEFTTDEEFKECWGLNNLQPLWAKDNLSKGAKLNWKKENK